MRIKQKMVLGSTLLVITPLVVMAIVLGYLAIDASRNAMSKQVENQLISLREAKKTQIEEYFKTLSGQIGNLSRAPQIQRAFGEMPDAFDEAVKQLKIDVDKGHTKLSANYKATFNDKYKRLNPGSSGIDGDAIVATMSPRATAMQLAYSLNNPHPLGSKNKTVSLKNGTRYDELHRAIPPFLDNFVQTFGYYDILLADNRGMVFDSDFKETDFATNLKSGTQASTQEIQIMIERLQVESRNAVPAMQQGREQARSGIEMAASAGHSLQSIASAVAAISDLNTQIASAAEEQSSVAEEVNRNIANISSVAECILLRSCYRQQIYARDEGA